MEAVFSWLPIRMHDDSNVGGPMREEDKRSAFTERIRIYRIEDIRQCSLGKDA